MHRKVWMVIVVLTIIVAMSSYVHAQVTADFSSSKTDACGSLKVDFYDQSTVTSGSIITTWEWDLGGAFSGKQNPGAIFADPGSFTICLTVTDNKGNKDTHCKENYINIFPEPSVDFTVDVVTGCSPVNVNLTDLSSSDNGNITRWIWDIGGSANVIDSPTALSDISTTYDVAGLYSLSLTVFDEKGCSATEQKKDLIKVNENIPLDIDYNILSSCNFPWEIQFLNLSPDPEIKYTWDFGNGEIFNGAFPPIVSYDSPGVYDLTIVTENGECTDTTLFSGYIDTEQSDDFSVSSDIICEGSVVQFSDNGEIFADSVLWIFGDGDFSRDREPIHIFDQAGCYPTQLVRYRSDCIDTIQGDCIQVFDNPEISYDIDNQFTCGVPIDITLKGFTTGTGSFDWLVTGSGVSDTLNGDRVDVTIEEFGRYDVTLTYTDVTGCTQLIDTIDLDIIPYSVRLPRIGPSGCIPLNAVMTDSVTSPIPIQSWDWTVFNRDSILYISTESSPTFAIADTGKYDVKLVVENIYGCRDTILRRNYIEAGIPPDVEFSASPLESCIVDIKQFTDLSESIANSWIWEFGDSTTSFLQNPEKKYNNPGVFDVRLLAFHNGCGNSTTKNEYINILYPRSSFKVKYNCIDPYTVNIINASLGSTEMQWSIPLAPGDTLTLSDSLIMPITFPARGRYPVSLYSLNDTSACEHVFIDTIVIADPIAGFQIDTTAGCVPLSLPGLDQSIDAERYVWTAEGASITRDTFFDPTLTYKTPGIFPGPSLKVTSIHGCQDSIQLMDSIQVNGIEASATFDNIVCVPGVSAPVSTSIDVLGTIVDYRWAINNTLYISNEEMPIFSIDTPGIYDLSLTVTDDWNCTDIKTYPMSIEALELLPDFTADTLSCTWSPVRFRAKNATANVDSFYWDFGDGNTSIQKNPNYTYSAQGIYSICLTMVDKRGCEKTVCKDNYVAIQDPRAEFSGDPLNANCPPLLTNFTNESDFSVTHFWDFGDNSGNSTNDNPSHVYTEPGVYDVTLIVSMSPACKDTMVRSDYVVLEGPKGSFTQQADSTCLPLDVSLSAQSDDLYTYIYDYGDGVLDSLTSQVSSDTRSYTYNQVGRYVPKIIIIDAKGCARAIAGDPVFVNTMDLDFTITDTSFCNTPADVELINLSASTSGNITYDWLMYGPQSGSSSADQPNFIMDSLGIYSVSLIGRSENCIDTLVKENLVEISVDPDVDFTILNDQLCDEIDVVFENMTTLKSGEITSYFWDFGDGATSDEENPSHTYTEIESFTVSLTAETRNGCTSTVFKELPVSPNTIGYAGVDDTICIGDQFQLLAEVENLQEGGGFYWQPDPSLSCTDCLDPVAIPDSSTWYTFIAVHPNGCESIDSVFITVIQQPGPTINLVGDSIICLGDEALFAVEDYDTSYTYLWEDSNNLLNCLVNCDTVKASPDGTSSFYVTVLNEYGCYVRDTLTVYVETEIGEILSEDKAICKDASTTIQITNGNIDFWDPNDHLSCLDCSQPTVTTDLTSYYYANVISDEGCHYRDSILVFVVSPETISAGEDELICVGEEITLIGSGVGRAMWYDMNNPAVMITEGYELRTRPMDTTSYVLMTIADECVLTDTVILNVAKKANIQAIGDSICPGEIATIEAMPLLTDVYWWQTAKGERIVNQDIRELSPDSTDRFMLIGGFRICEDDTAYAQIYVEDKINVEMEDFFKVYANEEVQFGISYSDTNNYSFDWNPREGLTCYSCPDPSVIEVNSNKKYKVQITDEDTGCKEEREVEIRFINECTNSVFYIPNIFSPNGDGNNDRFQVFTQHEEEFRRIHVFDRWGDKVYYSEDINDGWDGRFKGKFALPGVYVYRVDAYCELTGKEFYFTGDITLFR